MAVDSIFHKRINRDNLPWNTKQFIYLLSINCAFQCFYSPFVWRTQQSFSSTEKSCVWKFIKSNNCSYFVFLLGSSSLISRFAVGLAIALGQAFRCLHPPAGAVALLGVLLKASPIFIFIPVLSCSLILLIITFVFHHFQKRERSYTLHWL